MSGSLLNREAPNIRRDLAIGIFLVVVVLAVYGQVIHHDFVSIDDGGYVYDNVHVLSGVTWQGVNWAFTTMHSSNWHPLTWLSHMVDEELFGLDAGYHHLGNVFFHLLNTLLLFLLLKRMTGGVWRSAMVALLFAVHPLHVESVAWISERKDVLSTLFFMLTLLTYAWYTERPCVTRYFVVVVFLALGLMAKPMLVTMPFVLLLLDYWPLGRVQFVGKVAPKKAKSASRTVETGRTSNVIKLIVEKLPLFALVIASSAMTYVAQHQGKAELMNEFVSFGSRITNALVSYVAYLVKTLWPSGLAVFYPYPAKISAAVWIGALAVLVGVSAFVIWAGRPRRYLTVGWLWYLGTLVPVIGLIQVGTQSMADRYTYIPLIGIFIMVVWGVAELTSRWRYGRIGCAIAAGAVGLGCMVATGIQVSYWHNNITLFQHALNVTKDNYIAHINLGHALGLQGYKDKELWHIEEATKILWRYQEALKIRLPNHIPLAEIGAELSRQGRVDEALSLLRKLLSVDPENADVRSNLGFVLLKQGKLEEAIDQIHQALKLDPENADAHSNMGFVLTTQGKLEEAIDHFHEALKLDPQHTEAHNNLGTALERQGKLNEAIDQFRAVLIVDPKHREALNNVGVVLIKQGKLDEAVAHFREVLNLNPDFAEAHNNLGIILATQGKIDEAISQFREVVRIDPAYPEAQYKLGVLLTQRAEQGSHK